MSAHERFKKALDGQFRHLGIEARYTSSTGEVISIRVIARRPEQLFELGENHLHAENPQLEFRVSEVSMPMRGDEIVVENKRYRIEAEPRLDLHQLVWIAQCFPVGFL